MTTALVKTKKPAKKPTTKTKKPAKPAPAEPTTAQLDQAIDLAELANDLVCALDEATSAPTLDEYQTAMGEAGAVAARFMRRFATLAAKLDPEAMRAADERFNALPPVTAPALTN